MLFHPENNKRRWLSYFDLLGTSNLIRSGNIIKVFSAYQHAIGRLSRWDGREINVNQAWFSDTFILFTDSDSTESFAGIDLVSRYFSFSLIRRSIPFRGALACDEFYADPSARLYFGPALLDAYEYGEDQDWIGFILCPSAVQQLETVGLRIEERLNYTMYDVPFKRRSAKSQTKVAACILGEWIKPSGKNIIPDILSEMASQHSSNRIIKKYSRSIEFLKKSERYLKQSDHPGSPDE